MTKADKVGGKRQRTFTGCRTCRRRRVKCDEQRPICGHCKRLKLDCEGYDALIQWMRPVDIGNFEDSTEEELVELAADTRQSRRQLYSDAQRQDMCSLMNASARDLDYSKATARFEEDCQLNGETLTLGPFGAFSLSVPLAGEASEVVEDDDQVPTTQPALLDEDVLTMLQPHENVFTQNLALEDDAVRSQFPILPITEPSSNGLENWLPLADMSFDIESAGLSGLQDGTQATSLDFQGDDIGSVSIDDPLGLSMTIPRPSNETPHDMSVLLEHFVAKYVRPGSIWELQTTEIQKTLGQIALHLTPSDGNLAIFNAVLAISAYHLDRLNTLDTGSGYWWTVATEYKAKAISYLQAVLGHSTMSLDKAKYKTILMALLTMVNVCLTSGKLEEARLYLLDAQKLIKSSAKAERQQSRKIQMLHAVFIYLRVMEEATFIYPISLERSMNNNQTHIYSVTKFPSLAVKDLANTERGQQCLDFNQMIVPDWAFEAPGNTMRSLFANTLGLPESLLVLMSHTTFIACEARQARACERPVDAGIRQDFENRVKVIEELLCAWSYQTDRQSWDTADSPSSTPGSESGMRSFLEHIALAFHSALLLYFYREIKDVNRLILQTLVVKIKTHLLACENSKQQNNIPSSSVVWPGFMAAIEAIDEDEFAQIIGWMRSCADRYGARSFDRAITAATEIRSLRMNSGADSWPDVMLQKGIFLVLS